MAKREGIMLPYWWDANRFQKKYPRPCVVQPKINGNRCRAVPSPDLYTLMSSSEAAITSCPHIVETLNHFNQGKARDYLFELDGELYRHGWPHEMINGLVRTTSHIPETAKELEYWIFDIISEEPQLARLELLSSLNLFPLIQVEWKLIYTLEDLEERYYNYLEQGFEGIIIRHPHEPYHRKKTTTMMKLKPSEKGTFRVLGAIEEKTLDGTPKNQTGSLILQTPEGENFTCSGMKRDQRVQTWAHRETLSSQWALIKYQQLSYDRRVPVMPSFLGFVEKPS